MDRKIRQYTNNYEQENQWTKEPIGAGRLNPIDIEQSGYNDILCIKIELSYLRSSPITLQTHFKTLGDFELTTGEQWEISSCTKVQKQ